MISEGAVLGWSMEERLSKCEEIQQVMIRSGFPCYMKGLEEVSWFGLVFHYVSTSIGLVTPENRYVTEGKRKKICRIWLSGNKMYLLCR